MLQKDAHGKACRLLSYQSVRNGEAGAGLYAWLKQIQDTPEVPALCTALPMKPGHRSPTWQPHSSVQFLPPAGHCAKDLGVIHACAGIHGSKEHAELEAFARI